MKLKKFRIYHYKSIVDSGDCWLASDFTILIGKNESGKTAVLEALRDFDRKERTLSEQSVPLTGVPEEPSIEMLFQVEAEELDAILRESEITVSEDVRRQIVQDGILLTKSFSGTYFLTGKLFDSLFKDEPHPHQENDFAQITAKNLRLGELLNVSPIPDLKLGHDIEALNNSIKDLRRLVRSRLNFIDEGEKKVEIVELLHDMTRTLTGGNEGGTNTVRSKLTGVIVQKLPRFVFFSDFKDILPFEISIDALKSNQAVCDFARIASLDLDTVIKTQDLQKRINILNRSSAMISGEFLAYWEQSAIELIARPEGNKILFGVKEVDGTDFYKMEQRSKGFQWFLSFYLRLSRYKTDQVVLLVDEPGMNLHPIAQDNILKIMEEKSTGTMQVVFSTHSSALIDTERLDRLRFVVKTKEGGSTVIDNMHKEIDQETLMPVIAALGAQLPVDFPAVSNNKEEAPKTVSRPTPTPIQESVAKLPSEHMEKIVQEAYTSRPFQELKREEPVASVPPLPSTTEIKVEKHEENDEDDDAELSDLELKHAEAKNEEHSEEEPKKRSLFGMFRR